MHNKEERLIKAVYQSWKSACAKAEGPHPDEEELACFVEGRLSFEERERIKEHLVICQACAEYAAVNVKLPSVKAMPVPEELFDQARGLVSGETTFRPLEIMLKLKEKALEIVNTSGDILVGQELVPAPILRSRQVRDFKDEVTILKDFEDLRVEVKIENEQGKMFSVAVVAKEKTTSRIIKDVRVTLIKDGVELESYLSESGTVTFEHVLLGTYKVTIASLEKTLAAVILEIKR